MDINTLKDLTKKLYEQSVLSIRDASLTFDLKAVGLTNNFIQLNAFHLATERLPLNLL